MSAAGPDEPPRHIGALFDSRGDSGDLYRMGPNRDLLGRPAASLMTASPAESRFPMDIEHPEAYEAVVPTSGLVPAMLTAAIAGLAPGTPVAVAPNDTVAGLGWLSKGRVVRASR